METNNNAANTNVNNNDIQDSDNNNTPNAPTLNRSDSMVVDENSMEVGKQLSKRVLETKGIVVFVKRCGLEVSKDTTCLTNEEKSSFKCFLLVNLIDGDRRTLLKQSVMSKDNGEWNDLEFTLDSSLDDNSTISFQVYSVKNVLLGIFQVTYGEIRLRQGTFVWKMITALQTLTITAEVKEYTEKRTQKKQKRVLGELKEGDFFRLITPEIFVTILTFLGKKGYVDSLCKLACVSRRAYNIYQSYTIDIWGKVGRRAWQFVHKRVFPYYKIFTCDVKQCGPVVEKGANTYACIGGHGLPTGRVWGGGVLPNGNFDIYTGDSDFCTAARHCGIIGNKGGFFRVVHLPGQQAYVGSLRNEIRTADYRAWETSYRLEAVESSSEDLRGEDLVHIPISGFLHSEEHQLACDAALALCDLLETWPNTQIQRMSSEDWLALVGISKNSPVFFVKRLANLINKTKPKFTEASVFKKLTSFLLMNDIDFAMKAAIFRMFASHDFEALSVAFDTICSACMVLLTAPDPESDTEGEMKETALAVFHILFPEDKQQERFDACIRTLNSSETASIIGNALQDLLSIVETRAHITAVFASKTIGKIANAVSRNIPLAVDLLVKISTIFDFEYLTPLVGLLSEEYFSGNTYSTCKTLVVMADTELLCDKVMHTFLQISAKEEKTAPSPAPEALLSMFETLPPKPYAKSCGGTPIANVYMCRGKAVCTGAGTVWGGGDLPSGLRDNYTSDCEYCLMARHAGIIGHSPGYFKVFTLPGQQSYVGGERNGVVSRSYGPWQASVRIEPYCPKVTPVENKTVWEFLHACLYVDVNKGRFVSSFIKAMICTPQRDLALPSYIRFKILYHLLMSLVVDLKAAVQVDEQTIDTCAKNMGNAEAQGWPEKVLSKLVQCPKISDTAIEVWKTHLFNKTI